MNFQLHRPLGFTGKGDRFLQAAARDLKKMLIDVKNPLTYKMLCLSNKTLGELAGVLIEFAEDIHNDIGIWKSFEQYNLEFFGTRLPLTSHPDHDIGQSAMNPYRIRHLLWVLYSELQPDVILSPTHQDLCILAERISPFLKDRFAQIPRESGVKKFLAQQNRFGWDVKRKLVWLGQHSYLFRHSYQNYVEEHGGKYDITTTDDFVCQATTSWSGLGVTDILASALHITEKQRSTLRSWYERHAAYYKILAVKSPIMKVLNIINDKPYTIRVEEERTQFKPHHVVFGSLVPWNGEWYWSGTQLAWSDVPEEDIQQLKEEFLRGAPRIAYRYCQQLAIRARERTRVHYDEFVGYHGDDLAIYPDGHSLAADKQKKYRLKYERQPKEVVSQVLKRHNLPHPWPRMSFPDQLLECDNGVAVYCNRDEGEEIMQEFNHIANGLRKKGINLSEEEENSIRGFVYSDAISPQFVRKLVQKYGEESIAVAFLIRSDHDTSCLDYLLRRYKGHFYKKRYPYISFAF